MFPDSFHAATWMYSLTEVWVRISLPGPCDASVDKHKAMHTHQYRTSACPIHLSCRGKGGQQPTAGTCFKTISHPHRDSSLFRTEAGFCKLFESSHPGLVHSSHIRLLFPYTSIQRNRFSPHIYTQEHEELKETRQLAQPIILLYD